MDGLATLPVGNESSTPLGRLADISFVTSPNQFHHINGARVFDIIAAVALMAGILFLRFGGTMAPSLLMLQIPLAMTGGALALAASGLGLNSIGLVGFLTLAGVSLRQGVVLLDRAQSNEDAGMEPVQAMDEALNVRFRPIFLTTVDAVLGMLPTALGFGVGAAPEQGLAVVIAGGIVWSSLLSTNLIPALYIRGRNGRQS